MKKILIMIAVTTIAYYNVDAQAKKTAKEKCAVSADKKTVTCCKTTPNPAYNPNATPTDKSAVKKISTGHTSVAHVHQVCKEEGGYYMCCTHKKVTTVKTEKQVSAKVEK